MMIQKKSCDFEVDLRVKVVVFQKLINAFKDLVDFISHSFYKSLVCSLVSRLLSILLVDKVVSPSVHYIFISHGLGRELERGHAHRREIATKDLRRLNI